jgi:perosamine synthetase
MKNIDNIPFYQPLMTWKNIHDVSKQMKKGNSDIIKKLESKLTETFDIKTAIATSSGTAALMVAIQSLGIDKKKEIIVPAYGFPAAANAARYLGYKVKLIDIDIDSLCMSLNELKKYISTHKKVGAVIYICHNGQTDKMHDIYTLCFNLGIAFICDAATSIGIDNEMYDLPNAVVLSFSMPKLITAGQGGAIMFNNEPHAEIMARMLIDQGIPFDCDRLNKFHEVIGVNFKMSNIAAALCLSQLEELDKRIKMRSRVFNLYARYCDKYGLFFDRLRAWWPCIRAQGKFDGYENFKDKADITVKEMQDLGIQATRLYRPLNHFPSYNDKKIYANAEMAYEHLVYLPFSLKMSEAQIEKVCRVVREIAK